MKGTIKSKREIERLFQYGRRSSSSCMLVLAIEVQDDECGKCAFIAGKKIGTAPQRNRCKRVLREAAKECGSPWQRYNVVFVARQDTLNIGVSMLIQQMKRNLRKLGIINHE